MRAESRSRRLDATFLPSEVTKSFLRTHSARPRVDVKSATIGSKRTVDIEVGCSFLASARLGSMSACGRFCCKSRKSNNPKNLAKVDLWASLRLRRSLAPLRRSVIDFGRNDMVPYVAVRKTHRRL